VEDKWHYYLSTVTTAFHHFFPEKSLSTHPSDLPWITGRIKRLIQQRNQAFHSHNITAYKSLRNTVIREIKTAKKTFYHNKLQHLQPSQWYGKVRELCGLANRPCTFPCTSNLTPSEAAEALNDHFASICQQLPPLDTTRLPAYLPARSLAPTVSQSQVLQKLGKIRVKRATTPLDLPMRLIKEFAMELATPLTSIINASLQQSKCPSQWKTAFVTAIGKTPSPASFGELRPIAITPLPSLLCESFVADWAYQDLAPSVDTRQFGNMRSSSTTHCLVSFLDFVHAHLDKRKSSVTSIFIDFKKAFDLVDHTTVISKAAASTGIRECLIPWLADFLSNRQQAVRVQGQVSSLLPLTCGVPQGTRMGPLCFLVMINDALLDTEHRWKYVDDSTIAAAIDSSCPDHSAIQHTLDNLLSWTTANHVTINRQKSVVMQFDFSTNPAPSPILTLDNHPLDVVRSTKLLGVTIDDKLSWTQHVRDIVRSASYRLHMLRRLKSLGVPLPELQNIYRLFILPKLTYASPAWSPSLTATQLLQLERVQKRAAKIILGPVYTSYDSALAALGLTSLATHYSTSLQQFGLKLLCHPRHRDLLPPDAPPPRRALRAANKLVPIRARTDRYHRSTVPTLVRLINEH